jgi:U3 small nucleolar RNA-associated protein 7
MAAVTKSSAQSGKRQSPQEIIEAREAKKRLAEATQKYGRGKAVRLKAIKDRKLRGNLQAVEDRYQTAALRAKDAEILLENDAGFLEAEGELERTYKVRQDEIKDNVGIEVAKKGFELKLEELGPYRADYTRNGKNLLLAGRKGHVATMDWRAGKLGCELQLGETVWDAKWLHNDQFFAVAQKKNVYIYDHAGVELHCLNKHIEARYLEFLPYHFLLASAVSACSCITSSLKLLMSIALAGKQRLLKVYGHFNRAVGCRIAHSPWFSYLTMPKPLECSVACRSPEWHSQSVVAKLADPPRKGSRPPWSSSIHGR